MGVGDLLLQQVGLVEEEDGGGVLEPGVGQDGGEQGQALRQPVLQEKRGTPVKGGGGGASEPGTAGGGGAPRVLTSFSLS